MKSYLEKLSIRRERTLVRDAPSKPCMKITNSRDVAAILTSLIAHEVVEVFVLLAVDSRHRIRGYSEISRGSISFCPVIPADVLRAALLSGQAGFVVAHNHPSGDPAPSFEDLNLTTKLRSAFELVGLPLLDHVIVGDGQHFSFRDAGLLTPPKC